VLRGSARRISKVDAEASFRKSWEVFFVEEGRLKKAGGFEEVERARKLKDERIRREVWERQNGMTQADANAEPNTESAVEEAGEETAAERDTPADL